MRLARTSAAVCPSLAASLAFCLAILVAAPVHAADESEDGEPEASPVCENAAAEPAPVARAGRISTEELYDLTPFEELDPSFRALREAYSKRQWAAVIKLAPEVAERGHLSGLAAATWMLRAQAHEALKQWPDAERNWQRLAQSGVLAQRARLHLADLALKRKDVGEALVQLAAVAPWHVARDEATLTMARLELERDHVGPARDALERIEPHHLRPEQRAMYTYLLGEVHHRSGHGDDARSLYRQSWNLDREPYSGKAAKRLADLQAAPSPADQIERILRRREVKPGQLKGWLREAEAITEEDSGLRLYVQGSLWIRERSSRARAVEALHKATELLTDPVQLARALYAHADALGKTGDDRAGIEALQRIATVLQGEKSPAAAEVSARSLARLHRLYNAVDRPGDALAALRKLLDLHPDAQERELAVWGLGWQHFLAGNYPAALELFVKLEREHGNLWTGAQQPWRAKAIYWQARCLQQMGQIDAALEAWSSVTNTYAQTYYGILSLDRIAEIDADRAARLQGPPPSPTGSDTPPASLARLRVTRSQALDEAAILLRAGLQGEAKALLSEQLSKGLPRDGVHLLATLYDIGGNRRLAYGVMSRHTRRAARPDDSTAQVWRQSFPQAFYDEVDAATAQAAIGRSILYAIVRHESAFIPTVVSKAGAYGLVQVLPSAARSIAELYDLPYGGTGALLRPATNLQIGALYLAQLMSFYKGNLPVVAAAYNAGPYAARDWVKRWQNQPTDVFVENIPYPATRAYVMQVTASAQTYAWLYPEWQEISAGSLLRSPNLPRGFGPFMQKPGVGSTALVN
ncbi:MAG: transglycosylase SLT domain-containing protein [Deltaproteobacteria bacterium]|nr:transglycosylase SLT domain-containing protein [Deltaproteobacteria bacterium]